MWVKICANTNLADAQLAAELGADAIGFVFAPSKRQVTAEQVAKITAELPRAVEKIGVFTTRDVDEMMDSARIAGLTGVQVHSEFEPEVLRQLKLMTSGELRVLQVLDVSVSGGAESEPVFDKALHAIVEEPAVDAVLLDAAVKGVSGGTGVAFDWARIADVVRRTYAQSHRDKETLPKLIVAGGLRPETVGEAMAAFTPWGLDVASGVEASYGKKDPARLKAFLQAAKSASKRTR